MASGENYGYDQPGDTKKADPVNSGYDQSSDPPAYTPSPYGNQRGHHPMGQYPQGRQGHYPQGPQGQHGYYPPPAGNNNNINVVMSQPQMSTIIVNPRPNDYMGWSIFTLLCCCLPLGIAAIVFSSQSRSAADNMNFDQARKEASVARALNVAGLVCGVCLSVLMAALYAAGVFHSRSYEYEYGK